MDRNIIYIIYDLNYFKLHELALMREISHEYYIQSKYINFNIIILNNLIIKYLNTLPITMTMRSIYFKNKKNFNHNRKKYIKSLIIPTNKTINNIKYFSSFIFNNYYNIKNYNEFFNLNNNKLKMLIVKDDKFCCLRRYSGCQYINKRREIEGSLYLQSLLDFVSFSQTHPIKKYELELLT